MGCAPSAAQSPDDKRSDVKEPRNGRVSRNKVKDESGAAGQQGHPSKAARTCSKQGSRKRNQVVPLPTEFESADTKPAPDQARQRDAQAGGAAPVVEELQPLGSVTVQSLVLTGLTSWESRECALTQRWQPFIQELQDACTRVQAERGKVADNTLKVQSILERAADWLDMAMQAPHGEALSMLEACSDAACQLANCVLQPIVMHAERSLTNAGASSSSPSGSSSTSSSASCMPRGPRWDTLNVEQLVGALQTGSQVEYGVDLATAAQPAKLAAELLVMIQQHCSKDTKLLAKTTGSTVLALDKILNMLSIIFYRRVVLEEQAALNAKLEQLRTLRTALGWPDNLHLAACLEPRSRAMLAGLHQAAENGGERRANFQVRRGHAFWDSLQQALDQSLLPTSASLSSSRGIRALSHKVFPSFVDEWTPEGERGNVVLEAGEGHGPRKEFFALAAAGMTGHPIVSTSGQERDQDQEQHASLFSYNRSAGSFWYNLSLEPSEQLHNAYCFAGWLLGQSIINKAPLEVPLAPVLLQQLLQGLDCFQPDLHTLEGFDPAAASSIKNIAALPESDLKAMLEMEGLPLTMSSEQYMKQAIHSLLVESVRWQAQALISGFQSAIDVQVLRAWCIDAETLAVVLDTSGTTSSKADIDIRKVFRVVMDDELSGNGAVLGVMFWDIVTAWPRDRKLQLLQFVTGSSRLPLPGSELLKIEAPFVALGLAEHKAQLGMVPQAHTCDNLLELPNYWEALLQVRGFSSAAKVPPEQLPSLRAECARIMEERLTLAVTCFSGYGLDERDV